MQDTKKIAQILALAISSVLSLSACQTNTLQTKLPSSNTSNSNNLTLSTDRMMAHLYAFQEIAQKHGNHRAVGSAGGQESAQYIIVQAQKMGLKAQMLPFENRNKKAGQHIFVEIAGVDQNKAIMLGAHYDSVEHGPGINDNASGVAVLLELMQHYAKSTAKPKQNLTFVFWDSEEDGIASQDYVKKLTSEQLQNIKAYINVDMVGTKDFTAMVADADKSSVDEMAKLMKENGMEEKDYLPLLEALRAIPSHQGDLALEQSLKAFYDQHQIQYREDTSTLMASDTAGFMGKVPVGSLIFFNEQLTKDDVLAFAPCYHQACDTLEQIDPKSLTLAQLAIQHLIQNIE